MIYKYICKIYIIYIYRYLPFFSNIGLFFLNKYLYLLNILQARYVNYMYLKKNSPQFDKEGRGYTQETRGWRDDI